MRRVICLLPMHELPPSRGRSLGRIVVIANGLSEFCLEDTDTPP